MTQNNNESRPAPDAQTPRSSELKAGPEPENRIPVLSERRKKALVCYLAGLFGIAFLLVLGSLLMTGGQSADDAARIQSLESRVLSMEQELRSLTRQNETLTERNEDYAGQIDTLETRIAQMAEAAELIESGAAMEQARAESLSRRCEADALLIAAQNALLRGDSEALTAAMEALAEQAEFLDADATIVYHTILEQMDLPDPGKGN